jgi:chromate reductase, NAD(P)H dehydrogenase (quinone)
MSAPRILAFAGSTRRESFNRRLLKIAVSGAERAGADVTVVDLADYPLPLFNQDLHETEGLPEAAAKLKQLFLEHDALLIASPEYNSSITPLTKNTIDWVSRESADEGPLAAYRGKVAALMSASPGGLGGLRGLVHLRSILGNIGVLVLPAQIAIPQAHQAFTDDGRLKDEKRHAAVEDIGTQLVELTRKMKASN